MSCCVNIGPDDQNKESQRSATFSVESGNVEKETPQQILNAKLLVAVKEQKNDEVYRLLKDGANPEATCKETCVSACHVASLFSAEDALKLLLEAGADGQRVDYYGCTPLHYAASSGSTQSIAMLLRFAKDFQKLTQNITSNQETKIIEFTGNIINKQIARDSSSQLIPDDWQAFLGEVNTIRHMVPWLSEGSTPLLVASFAAHPQCVRLLLASGASPNLIDDNGRTNLDVVGSALYRGRTVNVNDFLETIKILLKYCGRLNSSAVGFNGFFDSVLHTAVRLRCLQALQLLLDAGAPIHHLSHCGYTPLHDCVEAKLEEYLKILVNHSYPNMKQTVEMRNYEGCTILHTAAETGWAPGVHVALEAGADITLRNNNGDTTLHSAVISGNLDIIKEILQTATHTASLLSQKNNKGETPFIKAIYTKKIEIISFLLDYDNNLKKLLFEPILSENMTPMEYAVAVNDKDLFKMILDEQTIINDKEMCRLVSVMAKFNRIDLFFTLTLKFHVTTYIRSYSMHEAVINGNVEMIKHLFFQGVDLSQRNVNGQTTVSLLMNHNTKPSEFLELLFDEYISSNHKHIYDKDYKITIDYSTLIDEDPLKQMDILEALLEISNEKGQRQLLIHPLVESFVYLMWKNLSVLIYLVILIHALFLMTLNIYLVSVFFHIDKNIKKLDIPYLYHPDTWKYLTYVTVSLVCTQEILLLNLNKCWLYATATLVKFGSIAFGIATPIFITMESPNTEWRRHLATIAIVLSWINMMIFLSSTPTWGYFVHMFLKVSLKIIKMIICSSFLVLCFAIIFMIQFHSSEPFGDPFAAFVKTTVMMTSEFDYENLFKGEITTSVAVLRVIFLLFLVLIAVVLMNLMVGVAVNDLQNLTHKGNLRRLEKQLASLCMLKSFTNNRLWIKLWIKASGKRIVIPTIVTIFPNKNNWYIFERRIRTIILAKAESNKVKKAYSIEETESVNYQPDQAINSSKKTMNETNILDSVIDEDDKDKSGIISDIRKIVATNTTKNDSNSLNLNVSDTIINKIENLSENTKNKANTTDGQAIIKNINKEKIEINKYMTDFIQKTVEKSYFKLLALEDTNIDETKVNDDLKKQKDKTRSTDISESNKEIYKSLNGLVKKTIQKTTELENAIAVLNELKSNITSNLNQMIDAQKEFKLSF